MTFDRRHALKSLGAALAVPTLLDRASAAGAPIQGLPAPQADPRHRPLPRPLAGVIVGGGTRGDIVGDERVLTVNTFAAKQTVAYKADDLVAGYAGGGHGGGDMRLVRDFLQAVAHDDPTLLSSTIEDSMESHRIGFEAEASRRRGGGAEALRGPRHVHREHRPHRRARARHGRRRARGARLKSGSRLTAGSRGRAGTVAAPTARARGRAARGDRRARG